MGIDTPGPHSRQALLDLSMEPDFAGFPDRLRLLARRRAAADAEFAPFDAHALADPDSRYELPPQDRDGIFATMMDRLDDFAHEVAHHAFTDRRTLRLIGDEAEMQRTLALRFEKEARSAFIVSREDEVADAKRTDIRLSARRGNQQAVIEVKLAVSGRWSVRDFELALTNQLIGKSLRHDKCRAGCLLLAYNGTQQHWVHPETQGQLGFDGVIAYLQGKARALEVATGHVIRLAVFGLDLTDPDRALARR